MRRIEAIVLGVLGLLLMIAGLVWLFGAYALVGSGVVLVAIALFTNERGQRDEPVPEPVPWQKRRGKTIQS